MKFLLLSFLLILNILSNAQVNQQVTNSNSNSINSAPEIIEFENPTIEVDEDLDFKTITIEQKSVREEKQTEVKKEYTAQELHVKMEDLLNDIKYTNSRKSPTLEQSLQMKNLINQYQRLNGQSFEYNYFSYLSGNYDVDNIQFLKKAERLKPNSSDVQIQLAAYFLIKDIKDSAALYLNKLVDVDRIDSIALIYGRDLLASVSQDGYLFTHGFDDTYACAYLQNVENYRNDVTLLPLDFFQSNYFVNRLKNLNGLIYKDQIIDNEYFKNIVLNNKDKKIHISNSFPKEYLLLLEEPIYTNGLTFVLVNSDSELIDNNVNFINSISKELILNANSDKAKQFSLNYLPVLFFLKEYYETLNNNILITEIDSMIDQIAIQANKYNQIKKLQR